MPKSSMIPPFMGRFGAETSTVRRRLYFRRDARVVVNRQPHQSPIRQHRHEFYEIVLILSGSGVHATHRFRHRIEAGDALVIDPWRWHGYEDPRQLNLVNVLVRSDLLASLARRLGSLPGFHALFTLASRRWQGSAYGGRLRIEGAEFEQAVEWVNRIEEESRRSNEAGFHIAEAYLILLVGLLARRRGQTSPAARPAPDITAGAGLGRLLSWIEVRLHERLPVARLASEAKMSVRTFHRRFLADTGTSPTGYVLGRRLESAADSLRHSASASIGEVAARCGFDDPNYFTRAFRRRFGKSPRQWAHSYAATPRGP